MNKYNTGDTVYIIVENDIVDTDILSCKIIFTKISEVHCRIGKKTVYCTAKNYGNLEKSDLYASEDEAMQGYINRLQSCLDTGEIRKKKIESMIAKLQKSLKNE